MMRCFRKPSKGRNTKVDEEEVKSSSTRKEFRFAEGRSEEESFMIKNGGLILEGLISSCGINFTPYRTFSKRQLQIATNNYARNRVVHSGLCHSYKGNLDDREVIVKNWFKIQCSITEVVVGLQMNNHKNALKLLGCCLETPIPSLVFDYAENGCLSDHIYEGVNRPLLSWESRLWIAIDVADGISYLHTGTSRPIIHRNIKPCNIFLDKDFRAKLTEFGDSLSIPLGETYVETIVVRTYGYADPVYVETGKCTEKSDVHGFAMVLFEILSGKRLSNCLRQDKEQLDEGNNKDLSFEDQIWRYFKGNILREGNSEQRMACAELARRCMVYNPEERPTMVEVAYELRRIQKGILHPASTSLSHHLQA
ncbi:non-functional pseudokinase ZED1-like [Telopea speciosissima]|uniref:non-functional pseudokinase ZED1-like n=1 Tax=Telopea speciosissima TaxID=54955 RepID=UPI001CC73399|nr:non-functional pseudokinase ZED1-like [Telopea speciosissima]